MSRPSASFLFSEELRPHLDRALELDAEQREQFLSALAATQPHIVSTIRELLARRDQLDVSGFLTGSMSLPPDHAALAGARIGAYTVERLIGRGGMGEVWLAVRSDGRFEGRCALKVVGSSLSTKLAERFRREGQLLARLTHPNIARLLDAGATPDGRAYLALEYIEGEPIDCYCESLPIDARVRLFVDVVAAVAHAHTQLIVHRDIKPSNVLVTRNGEVKLLDFGIAKLLSADPTEDAAALTRLEDAALTPQYAAPEQLRGELPSTATDVYQLGTLLYVLLTGCHPVAAQSSRSDALRAALAATTARASNAVSGAARKVLRGDLDAILAFARRGDPADRYPTAQAFKDDLLRYLNKEPVLARSGVATYRVRKFVSRHRAIVGISSVAVVGLCAALVFALVQGREATFQRDAARRELARSNATNDFTTFLLSVAAPGNSKFTAAELLQQSEQLIAKQFAGDQALKADLLATLGLQFMQLERWVEAEAVLTQAATIADETDDASLRARAQCPLAMLIIQGGDSQRAETLIERALGAVPDRPEYTHVRAECLLRRSEFGYFLGDGQAMTRYAKETLALLEAAPSASPARRVDARAALAYGHYLMRENDEADRQYALTMVDFEALGRERTLTAAAVLNNWALVHYRGDIRKAEPLMRRSFELHRSIEGEDGITPTASFNYAGLLLRIGSIAEAAPVFEEAIRTAQARQELRVMFDSMMQLADARIQSGQLDEAEAQVKRVIAHVDHPRFDQSRRAQLAYVRGHLAEARADLSAARTHYAESARLFDDLREKIALNVDALAALARCELAAGNASAANDAAQRGLRLAQSLAEPSGPSYLVGAALLAVGDVQRASVARDSSRSSYRSALENLEQTLGPGHALTEAARAKATMQ